MTDSWVTTHDARPFNDRVVHGLRNPIQKLFCFFAHLIKNAILNMPAGINDCNSFPQRYAGILLKLQLNGKMQVYVSVSHAKTGRMFLDMPERDAEAVPGQLLDAVMMTLYIAA